MNLKRFLASILPILFIFVFPACGCAHEWTEATCTNPKTCNLCGVTEGDLIEHSYIDADCETPKRCSHCDTTEGDALGHDYIDGYCTRCFIKDPDYVNLNDLGFSNMNMYGKNILLDVFGYNFSKNSVSICAPANEHNRVYLDFYIFSHGYFQTATVESNKDGEGHITSITEDMLNGKGTTVYNTVSNDVISFANAGTFTINDRAIDETNSKIVLKTCYDDMWDYAEEHWLVPIDSLDFSTLKFDRVYEKNSSVNIYTINFK